MIDKLPASEDPNTISEPDVTLSDVELLSNEHVINLVKILIFTSPSLN